MEKHLNYKFQKIDNRDLFHISSNLNNINNNVHSLKNNMPEILNQGQLGSCVSNAISLYIKYLNKDITPSRLYIYFNGRAISDGELDKDTGLSVRDGCKSISKYGVCQEFNWPYDITQYTKLPSFKAYNSTIPLNNFIYLSVNQDIISIQNCINNNNPIIFGFIVYESFLYDNVSKTGIVSMPTPNEIQLGGHCCLIIGYDNINNVVICANSWGTSWGDNGYFYLPYKYILDNTLANDFWIMKITKPIPPSKPKSVKINSIPTKINTPKLIPIPKLHIKLNKLVQVLNYKSVILLKNKIIKY